MTARKRLVFVAFVALLFIYFYFLKHDFKFIFSPGKFLHHNQKFLPKNILSESKK